MTRIDGDVQKKKEMNKTAMCPTDSTCKWHSEESPYHALALPFPYTYLKDLSLIYHTKRAFENFGNMWWYLCMGFDTLLFQMALSVLFAYIAS